MPVDASMTTFVSGFDTTEGPAFDREGDLYFVNSSTSAILRRRADGSVEEFANTGGIPAGLAFHRDGSLYVADEGDAIHGVLRIAPDGTIETIVDHYLGQPLNGANDLVFDANGVLYFSDPWRSSKENPIGGFYRYSPAGELEQIDRGLAFPNGVAINADGSAVFLAETYQRRILRYQIGAGKLLGKREVFAALEGPVGPDGMAFDVAGNLYVAYHGGGRVDVIAPSGQVVDTIPVLGELPTNVAFGGHNRSMLVVTEYATHAIYSCSVPIPGQVLFGDID